MLRLLPFYSNIMIFRRVVPVLSLVLLLVVTSGFSPQTLGLLRRSTCFLNASSQHSRRDWLGAIVVPTATLTIATESAEAKYGESSSMELPNYIEYLIEKNSQTDTSKSLYQGADPKVLLQRLVEANQRLSEVASLAEARKWSQIQGLVTGPLGTLSQTLNSISSGNKALMAQAKQVKNTVIAIGQAAEKKNGEKCAQLAEQASLELREFVKLAFE